ncbi:hypothetical protein Clacol_000343 [Clathrus columnatus]|uniref:Uncharacterized protein n=1 Tax=Clathrus columnatus TaxID=1419009 RepID=A0AAV4ZYU9_9AGAM|nr:hypothetical protein Clacol_000343 [Clathrus columnatus]
MLAKYPIFVSQALHVIDNFVTSPRLCNDLGVLDRVIDIFPLVGVQEFSRIIFLVRDVTVILLDALAFIGVFYQVWGLWRLKQSMDFRSGENIAAVLLQQSILRFSLSVLLICEFTIDLRRRSTAKASAADRGQSAGNCTLFQTRDNSTQSLRFKFGRLHNSIMTEMGENDRLMGFDNSRLHSVERDDLH